MNLNKTIPTCPPDPERLRKRLMETGKELRERLEDERRSFHEKRKRDSKENRVSGDCKNG